MQTTIFENMPGINSQVVKGNADAVRIRLRRQPRFNSFSSIIASTNNLNTNRNVRQSQEENDARRSSRAFTPRRQYRSSPYSSNAVQRRRDENHAAISSQPQQRDIQGRAENRNNEDDAIPVHRQQQQREQVNNSGGVEAPIIDISSDENNDEQDDESNVDYPQPYRNIIPRGERFWDIYSDIRRIGEIYDYFADLVRAMRRVNMESRSLRQQMAMIRTQVRGRLDRAYQQPSRFFNNVMEMNFEFRRRHDYLTRMRNYYRLRLIRLLDNEAFMFR